MKKKDVELFKKEFGENLLKIRERKKLSLLQVSYNCAVDNSKISKIEHGRFDIRLSTILELAKGLEVHPKELFDFEMDASLG